MPFVILRHNPYQDSDDWEHHFAISACLILNGTEDRVAKFVDNANAIMQAYKYALLKITHQLEFQTKENLIEKMIKHPPWTEMVKIIGPKPSYDHSMETNKDYNTSHKNRVSEWKKRFYDWTNSNNEYWTKRATDLAALEWENINKIDIDISHPIFSKLKENIINDRGITYLPYFSYVMAPEETLDG